MSKEDESKSTAISIPKTSITIYGGKKTEVGEAAKKTLDISDEDYYSTWISLGIMRRLGFLFEGGVESAGSPTGLVLMVIVLVAALALFALWQVLIVFVVIAVLALLSGGAALKFLRATYITKPLNEIDSTKLEEFMRAQASEGHFVKVEGIRGASNMGKDTMRISNAALTFRTGIQFSILVASAFLILEIACLLVTGHWLSGQSPVTGQMEAVVLICFGFLFVGGVVMMDIGVLLRNRLQRELSQKKKK